MDTKLVQLIVVMLLVVATFTYEDIRKDRKHRTGSHHGRGGRHHHRKGKKNHETLVGDDHATSVKVHPPTSQIQHPDTGINWEEISTEILNRSRTITDMVAPWLHGHIAIGPDVNMDWDLSELFGLGGRDSPDWWKGPNVCVGRDEKEEDIPGISNHHFYTKSTCDQTEASYKCTTEVGLHGKKKMYTITYECCHGYQKIESQAGCPRELDLKDLVETVSDMGALQFSSALQGVRLNQLLNDANYTIFAPTDEMFKEYEPPLDINNNIVIVSSETRFMTQHWRQLLMSHVIPDIVPTGKMEDEQTFKTINPHAKIRINFYNTPRKLITANCKRVVSPNNPATNGVVHIVDGVLEPAEETLSDLIGSRSDLSTLKTLIGKVGLNQVLKEEGQFTVLAPSNAAFDMLGKEVMTKLLQGDACLMNLIKNHVLANVICSSVIEGKVRTLNLLNRYVNLTRTEDDKVFMGTGQLVIRDIMATNGVLHVLDKVVVPDDSLDVLDVMEKAGGNEFLSLVRKASLSKVLQNLSNYTLFLPSNTAIQALSNEKLAEYERDPVALEKIIKYHVAMSPQMYDALRDNEELETLDSNKNILVKEYFSAPFGWNQIKTVQCAAIIDSNYRSCDAITHIVDKVLLPPKGDIYDTLSLSREYSTLVSLMKKAGLSEELQLGGPYTFLAPTNEAFTKLDSRVWGILNSSAEILKSFLQHHILQGQLCCAGVFDSHMFWKQNERALDASFIGFARNGDNVIVDRNTQIEQCDITASNGVIHSVNQVLHSALKLYAPQPRRRGFLERVYSRRHRGNRRPEVQQQPFMEGLHRSISDVWDNMHDWDWYINYDWQPIKFRK